MPLSQSPMVVTRCNTSQVYADFRQPVKRAKPGLAKLLFDFLFFLFLIRILLDLPAVRAAPDAQSDLISGSGDGLNRKCRQIFVGPPKSFFEATRSAKRKKMRKVKKVKNEIQTTSASSFQNIDQTTRFIDTQTMPITTQSSITENITNSVNLNTTTEYFEPASNVTDIVVDFDSKMTDKESTVMPIIAKVPICRRIIKSEELERGKRNGPLHLNKDSPQVLEDEQRSVEDSLNVNFNDFQAQAKGKEIILYVCLALTAIFALERGTQVLLCICQRLNNRPSRRERRNFEHLNEQENRQLNIIRERLASMNL